MQPSETQASETAAGRAWLRNFADVDVPAASILLDSLRFVSLSVLSSGLQMRARELMASGAVEAPAMAIPERALSDFPRVRRDADQSGDQAREATGQEPERVDGGDASASTSKPAAGEAEVRAREGAETANEIKSHIRAMRLSQMEKLLVAFDDFSPGGPMSVTPGSEGLVGRLLRDFARAGSSSEDGSWIGPDASIERLRELKVRSIVIATDYVGSGDQMLALAEAIARNATIRSWRSLGLLKIYALAFAATPDALIRLRRSDVIAGAWSVEGAPTFDTAAGWIAEAREEIRQLCITETRIDKKWALGWHESEGLFASEHGVPNNLPAVFWQGKGWRPLFPWRKVPPEVARELGDLRPRPTLRALAEHVGQLRIGRNERLNSMPKTSRLMLKLLILMRQRRRSEAFFAAVLGIDVEDVVGLREALERLDLVDVEGRVTRRGRMEISAQKGARRRTTAGLVGSDEPYYPRSLR